MIFLLMVFITLACRDETAGCNEKAYDFFSINEAKQILMFSSDQELSEYIREVGLARVLDYVFHSGYFDIIYLR